MGDNAFGYLDVFMDNSLQIVPTTCKIILPTAPQRKVTVNNGVMTHAWYDMISLNFKEESKKSLKQRYNNFNQTQIKESVKLISELIDAEVKILGLGEKVFLGGFSQGCAIALATFLLSPYQLGGIVGLSGSQCADIDLDQVNIELKRKTPLLIYHGEADSVTRLDYSKFFYEQFDQNRFNWTLKVEKGLGHSISTEELEVVKKFFWDLMI